MEIIKPSSILRDYNKVVNEVQDGEPIVLTKNGVGKAVMVNLDEWQRKQAEVWLLTELNRAEADFGEGEDIDEFAKKYKLGDFGD
ncbi:type II toxin-antitoxin system prevent-host-death family antitoxin [Lactiplantibacillus herbarum]|uniref:type II toxin-antitoxin system prevent-host-death family antitoxin n=1 Tax=Lactiplantibacillus herbarum TaxID=1670446 RepID=UPI00064E1E56|nr:type II toxin-antitoxin system prevent-host-death family antitoxin [Lactiplantibacillus herbarum]